MNDTELQEFAASIRQRIIEMAHNCKQGVHIGGALSMVDLLAVLYGQTMRYDPQNPEAYDRDRFILSKGHACAGLYAALNLIGVISDDELKANYQTDGGCYQVHTTKKLSHGIECTSGSLGMGLSFGIGKALAGKLDAQSYKVYVVAGDGECNEGEIWEAAAAAKQYQLDNLILIIDRNRFQNDGKTEEIMDIDLAAAFKGFGWNVTEIDGHDHAAIREALQSAANKADGVPSAIVANTIKGKGVSFMENNNAWHHGHLTEKQYLAAKEELYSD